MNFELNIIPLKSELEMEHFINLNNDVMPTQLLHNEVLEPIIGYFGKVIGLIVILVLANIIVTISIGLALISKIVLYLWQQLTPGMELLEIMYLFTSFVSFIMFGLFFYELSRKVDKKIERRNQEKKE
jgi:hypothetical protein